MENCSAFAVVQLLTLNPIEYRLHFWMTNVSEHEDHFVSKMKKRLNLISINTKVSNSSKFATVEFEFFFNKANFITL